jgi:hypothetical protein
MKWTPELIIAIILILGCLGLILSGIDGEVKSILTLAAGWTFGNQYGATRKRSKKP